MQAAYVVLSGVVFGAWARRRSTEEAAWAIVLIMTAVKVITDPVGQAYYWLPVHTAALIGLGLLLRWPLRRAAVLAASGLYVVLTWPSLGGGFAGILGALLASNIRLPVASRSTAV